jgi:hypothetical protein
MATWLKHSSEYEAKGRWMFRAQVFIDLAGILVVHGDAAIETLATVAEKQSNTLQH